MNLLSRRCALVAFGSLALPVSNVIAAPQRPGNHKSVADKKYFINFNALVTSKSIGEIQRIAASIANTSPGSELYIMMATPGGDAASATATFAFLRALPLKIVTIALAQVASAGIVMFLAGDRRIATALSSFLFHASFIPVEEADETLESIKSKMELLTDADAICHRIYAERMGISYDTAAELEVNQNIFGPKSALDKGIATEYSPNFSLANDKVYAITEK